MQKCVQYEEKAKQFPWMPMQEEKICFVVTIANVKQTGEEVCSPEEKGNSCSISQTSEIIEAEGKL